MSARVAASWRRAASCPLSRSRYRVTARDTAKNRTPTTAIDSGTSESTIDALTMSQPLTASRLTAAVAESTPQISPGRNRAIGGCARRRTPRTRSARDPRSFAVGPCGSPVGPCGSPVGP